MLTCAPLKLWSINYYNRTAQTAGQATKDAAERGGGLGEYYTEADTRAPVWMVAGDAYAVAELAGLTDEQRAGGTADLDTVARWLDEGIAPNGARGRQFAERDNRGFDATVCAPKSVSLLRAYGDDVTQKAVQNAHTLAMKETLEYLADHAGYTRVHNKWTGKKDLQKLPGLVAAAYQHETSRAGDPHLHTHVIVPNKQARADGKLAAIDSDQLWHEAKAAGVIYQATLRRELARSIGAQWQPVDAHTGMAELVGIDRAVVKAHSTRSTQLREWAGGNLELVDGQPTAGQLAKAQKATRPKKPEGMAWAELRAAWRADPRGFRIDHAAVDKARREQRTTASALNRRRIADMAAGIDKAAFTRADLVEIIGAQLPVEVDGDDRTPRQQVEAAVDEIAMRINGPREAHHREGNSRYTVDLILVEEHQLFDLADARNDRAALRVFDADAAGLSEEQRQAVTAIAASPWLTQPLTAPAGAGKTHTLKALHRAANRAGREVIVLAPQGRAVDVAIADCAGDRGYTVDKALVEMRHGRLSFTADTVVVVDEAGLIGNSQLLRLLEATTKAGTKVVLVGDPHQLAPVCKRGGIFEQFCTDLPWTQTLTEVWRMRDEGERTASCALRDGDPSAAITWYSDHDRLHTGDEVTMAADALQAYRADITAGRDALLIPDSWELADALNKQIHAERVPAGALTITAARGHQIGVGDTIVTRQNTEGITVAQVRDRKITRTPASQVRNGQRWTVRRLDTDQQRIWAQRHSDGAVAALEGDYLREHVHHGYAVTLASAQGVTADTSYPIVAARTDRSTFYVGMTRGRHTNTAFIYDKIAGEQDHEHADPVTGIQQTRRGTSTEAADLARAIINRDNRPTTAHHTARQVGQDLLPGRVARLVAHQRAATERRRDTYQKWVADLAEANQAGYPDAASYHHARHLAEQYRTRAAAREHHRSQDDGYDIGL